MLGVWVRLLLLNMRQNIQIHLSQQPLQCSNVDTEYLFRTLTCNRFSLSQPRVGQDTEELHSAHGQNLQLLLDEEIQH